MVTKLACSLRVSRRTGNFVAAKTHIAIGLSLVSLRSGLICLREIFRSPGSLTAHPMARWLSSSR